MFNLKDQLQAVVDKAKQEGRSVIVDKSSPEYLRKVQGEIAELQRQLKEAEARNRPVECLSCWDGLAVKGEFLCRECADAIENTNCKLPW